MSENQHESELQRMWIEQYFGRLYEKYHDDVKLFLCRRALSKDINEVVEEVFERLYIHIRTLPPEQIQQMKFPEYLYSIAKHYLIDQNRHNGRSKKDVPLELDDAVVDQIDHTTPLPEEEYIEKEMKERFEEAIAKLPEKLYVVIKGWLEGKRFVTIAKELEIEPATVGYRFRQALEKMRAMPEIQEIKQDYL